jgi:chromosome segregation ATPase
LATEMESARLKMAELELKLTELKRQEEVVQSKQLKENINPISSIIPKGISPRPSVELKKLLTDKKELKEQVENLTKENELLKTALNDLQKKNENLSNKIDEESLNSKSNNKHNESDERETMLILMLSQVLKMKS